MAKIEVQGANAGFIEIPDTPPPSGDGGIERPQWQWVMQYLDAGGFKRTINPNTTTGLGISSGRFPPNYRIPNGQPGGGFPPSGQQAVGGDREPIRIVPVERHRGRLIFITNCKASIYNPDSSREGQFTFTLGTTSSSANVNQPLFPYLGVAHDLDVSQQTLNTIAPKQTVQVSCFRLEVCDNAFAAVPNWPNWEMVFNTTTTLLRPAINPMLRNGGPVALEVSGIQCMAWGT